jgi:siderophore synthetase component
MGFASDLVHLLLPPLLRLLHLGASLEAHGQNTLVLLRSGRPCEIWYRDMGGVRLSPKRLSAAGVQMPPLHGELPSDEPEVLRTKLFAALAVVLSELAATLTRAYGTDPGTFWQLVARVVRGMTGEVPDAHALFGPTLPIKATTAMRLAADPIEDLWTQIPNPLAGLR